MLSSNDPPEEKASQLIPLVRGVHDALDKVANSIPGQRDVEDSISAIIRASSILESGVDSHRGMPGANYGYVDWIWFSLW